MGLITHNRIYVCIGASPYPVIVDLVIIGSRGIIILFIKGCLNPSCPICAVAVAALYRRKPLGVGRWRPLLAGSPRAATPCRVPSRSRPPPYGYGLAKPGCPSFSLPSLREHNKNA
ncbi:hypothetical protein B296_00013848 [Ensete ventricosum]|uniref:Uncharacterized protein n=1 Tax=Ensete ventricosum TaxID=4639 RepID=A0A426Z1G9_ENSVE|nr:hypothetical protein B296_00013848 [Ensete ventricosum]